ncbi:hypothetical protein SUGI_0550920 [Cryptomeria japonica]|nr:hypothetical protein SUGI_0550920 [Cryptomeria japonica]
MKKSSVYKYIGACMLVWVLFEKAYAGSTFIAYPEPGCPNGPVVGGEGCGCISIPSDHHGGYIFTYQSQGIALFDTAGCAGKPLTVLTHSEKDCNPFGWNSVFFYC